MGIRASCSLSECQSTVRWYEGRVRTLEPREGGAKTTRHPPPGDGLTARHVVRQAEGAEGCASTQSRCPAGTPWSVSGHVAAHPHWGWRKRPTEGLLWRQLLSSGRELRRRPQCGQGMVCYARQGGPVGPGASGARFERFTWGQLTALRPTRSFAGDARVAALWSGSRRRGTVG